MNLLKTLLLTWIRQELSCYLLCTVQLTRTKMLAFQMANWITDYLNSRQLSSFHHLNSLLVPFWITWLLNGIGVLYSNGIVTWLGCPFQYWTFWTINRLLQSSFQNIIWIPDHLTTYHLNTGQRHSDGYCGNLYGSPLSFYWHRLLMTTPGSATTSCRPFKNVEPPFWMPAKPVRPCRLPRLPAITSGPGGTEPRKVNGSRWPSFPMELTTVHQKESCSRSQVVNSLCCIFCAVFWCFLFIMQKNIET